MLRRLARGAFAALLAVFWFMPLTHADLPQAAAAPRVPQSSTSAGSAVHMVQAGDTLWSIAQRHGMTLDALLRASRLSADTILQPGQAIVVRASGAGAGRAATRPARGLTPRVGPLLAWPSRGVITSRFGWRGRRHHHGIDIAAPVGTPVTAAQPGVVEFAGWMGGYGLLVILNHGGGLTTYYGHASQLLVNVGDRVQRGQLVARVGTTGDVTGPNLHFEVRRNKVPLDPLAFLQRQR